MSHASKCFLAAACLAALEFNPEMAAAQLLLRLPIHFGEFEQGSSFQTTPFPLANADHCSVSGDQPTGSVQCGEVDTEPGFAFAPGGPYTARVTATPLTNGSDQIVWTPTVACVRVDGRGESIVGGSGSFCSQSVAISGQGIFWDLGGVVSMGDRVATGQYSATVTLSVQGAGIAESIAVGATLRVRAAPVTCAVTSGSSIQFGQASARKAGTVTIDATTGQRSYAGGQTDPSGSSSYSASEASVRTNARTVTASVTTPSVLGGSLSYTGFLAYRRTSTAPFVLGITGSGSTVVTVGESGLLSFRLGGRVTTSLSSTAAPYSGTVHLSFLCS